jgi:hypothetical protein
MTVSEVPSSQRSYSALSFAFDSDRCMFVDASAPGALQSGNVAKPGHALRDLPVHQHGGDAATRPSPPASIGPLPNGAALAIAIGRVRHG